jgi:hypothetical protein
MTRRYVIPATPDVFEWHRQPQAPSKPGGPVTPNDLAQQLANPRHCHVEVSPGRLFSHNPRDPYLLEQGLAGKPVRFSFLAAGRMVEELRRLGFNRARVLPYPGVKIDEQ